MRTAEAVVNLLKNSSQTVVNGGIFSVSPNPQSPINTGFLEMSQLERPEPSELSGRQRRNPGFMRASGISHKIRTRLQKSWEPLVRLGSHGFSGFWEIVVKQ